MKILLPNQLHQRLSLILQQAGERETGGILMGEHVETDVFRIKDLSVQRHSGNFNFFLRFYEDMIQPLRHFFSNTGHDYQRFNYLGEWHSHPNFPLHPSQQDEESIKSIVTDAKVGANFVILLIVKLAQDAIEGSVTVFLPTGNCFTGELILEDNYD